MVETGVRTREMFFSSGEALFMEDPFPRGLWGPDAGAWLGVAWGPLSPSAVSKSLSTLSSAAAVSKPLGPKVHTPADGIVPPVAAAGLLGMETVAQREASTQLSVPGAPAPAVPGVGLPLAEAVVLLVPGVTAALSHPVPCLSAVCVVPGVPLLAAGVAVPQDPVRSSPAAVGRVPGEPVEMVRFMLKNSMSFWFPTPQR